MLNELLVNLFHNIMDIEEKAIITEKFKDMTNNDMHVIEAIGIGEAKNMSSIARELSVTVGTLTISMNSLVRKGYVVRRRSEEDRRVVYICLSEKGKQAYEHHARFHQNMIETIIGDLSDEEKEVLIRTLNKLNYFFKIGIKEELYEKKNRSTTGNAVNAVTGGLHEKAAGSNSARIKRTGDRRDD